MLNGLENPHGVRLPKKLCKCSKRWLKEDSPLSGVLFFKSKFLVSCTWTCHDPVGHTSNSTVTTSTGDSTEHTEDERLGVNICCSSASALCQTGNNDGKSWNFPSYLYLREIQPVEPVSLERSDFEEQQENSRKQDEKEDGILEHDSPLVMIVTFHLWNERLIFTWEDENQLRKKYLLQLQCNGCHAFATGH